jgi:hypothetical protein
LWNFASFHHESFNEAAVASAANMPELVAYTISGHFHNGQLLIVSLKFVSQYRTGKRLYLTKRHRFPAQFFPRY